MFTRKTLPHPDVPAVLPPQQTDGLLAARRARQNTRDRLLDAVDSGVESRTVAERMRSLLEQNNFGPTIEQAFLSDQERDR